MEGFADGLHPSYQAHLELQQFYKRWDFAMRKLAREKRGLDALQGQLSTVEPTLQLRQVVAYHPSKAMFD